MSGGLSSHVVEMGLCRRLTLFMIGLLECAIFGGLVFGWPQLVLVLKNEGIYGDLCQHNTSSHAHHETVNSRGVNNSVISVVMATDAPPFSSSSPCDWSLDCSSMLRSGANGSLLTQGIADGAALSQEEEWELWKLDQCSSRAMESMANISDEGREKEGVASPCAAQDSQFALIFTIAVVCYSLPSVLVGYLLHYAGLWFTRILASLMLIISFICMGLATPERPQLLFPAMTLLAMGGNQLRLCAVQLGDLFPARRATAITLLTGSYSASSSIFFLFQVTADAGLPRTTLCWVLAAVSGASLLATLLMPVRHVSQHMVAAGEQRKVSHSPTAGVPLSISLLSLSSALHQYWLLTAFFAINSYQQTFNYWVTASSCTTAEVRQYTGIFSFCGLVGAAVAPVLGHVTDSIVRRAKKNATCAFDFRVREVCANFVPLLITSLTSIGMYSCLLFFTGNSIYTSLVCLIVCRSCIFSTSTAFLRARFPVEHLDRLLGIYGSVASVLLLLQYPHFVWATSQYYLALGVALALMCLNLTYPLHLLYRKGIRNALLLLPQPPALRTESLLHKAPSKLTSSRTSH